MLLPELLMIPATLQGRPPQRNRPGRMARPRTGSGQRLEEAGVIEGYAARISPAALGFGICVMVSVKLAKQSPDAAEQFRTAIRDQPEITECLLVTGNVDYLLRVWVKDIEALRTFIGEALQAIPCVAETSTMVILDTQTSNGLLSVPGNAQGGKAQLARSACGADRA